MLYQFSRRSSPGYHPRPQSIPGLIWNPERRAATDPASPKQRLPKRDSIADAYSLDRESSPCVILNPLRSAPAQGCIGGSGMIKVVNWNIARRKEPLSQLAEMDADVALLQEVGAGMAKRLPCRLETGGAKHWDGRLVGDTNVDRWPMIVKMSDKVEIEWFNQVGAGDAPSKDEFAIDRIGSLAVARIIPKDPKDGEPFIAASMYARWNSATGSSGSTRSIAGDISALIKRELPDSRRILTAGDINVNFADFGDVAFQDWMAKSSKDSLKDKFGYIYHICEDGDSYTVAISRPDGEILRLRRRRWKTLWGARKWSRTDMKEQSEFRREVKLGKAELGMKMWDRMDALGLQFMGPQYPNGRKPESFPRFIPATSNNLVTYYIPGESPKTGFRQLDYVFASRGFHNRLSTRALNCIHEWGASDHCRILIEVAP